MSGEFEVLAVAAATSGLTPTGYGASTAVAGEQVRPMPSRVGDVVRELVDARVQRVRYGVLLNQAVARLNATGEAGGGAGPPRLWDAGRNHWAAVPLPW